MRGVDRAAASSLYDLIPHRITYEFAHGMQLEFAHNVRAMRFRRLHADSQSHGDFLAALAFREQLDDFTLARGQPAAQDGHVVRDRILLAESIQQHVGGTGCEKGTVVTERFHSGDEITVGVGLHDVRADASLDDVADELIGKMKGQNDDFRLGKAFANAPGGFQAVQLRHADVHHNDVGFHLFGQSDRFTTGLGFGANVPALVRRQELFQPAADDVVVVGD
jgi:hypothetical protein